MTVPLVVLAAITLAAGWLVIPQWMALIPQPHAVLSETLIWTLTGGSLALAILGILWGYTVYGAAPAKEPLRTLGPLYRGATHLWFVDAFFTWIAHHVVLTLGRTVRRFDKRVIDGGLVDGAFWLTGRLGHALRRAGAGPLPGQLQYYAVIIFAIAVLVMLIMAAPAMPGLMGVLGR